MQSRQTPDESPTQGERIYEGVGKAKEIWRETLVALRPLSGWERAMHVFWLFGPFILLIERSPADVWLSVIALTFAARSIARREGWWLRVTWVRLAFLFWGVCLLSAAVSPLPAYSLGEAFVWFRFPLFAMAVVFWLGRDKRFVYAMLLSVGLGMMIMCAILVAEISIIGVTGGRLSWPYGDLVPGNYLAKACLPAFVVVVALAVLAVSLLWPPIPARVEGTTVGAALRGGGRHARRALVRSRANQTAGIRVVHESARGAGDAVADDEVDFPDWYNTKQACENDNV